MGDCFRPYSCVQLSDAAVGGVMICPVSHKHGAVSTCYYKHKCRCEPCRDVARAVLSKRGTPAAPRLSPRRACERCGVERVVHTSRVHPWCRDCRLVESVEIQEAWAA